MKTFFSIIIILITFISCEKNEVRDALNCSTTTNFANTKEITGILKHFKINVPKSWKSELYYDEIQSRIYSADTTIQLTQTYIIDVTWYQGEIELDDNFEKIIINNLKQNLNLTSIKANFGYFKGYPCYFNLAQGLSSGFEYHYLQIYVKTNIDEYFNLTTKVYGGEFIDERLCESISLFDGITFY